MNNITSINYGSCIECHSELQPIWFTEEEYKVYNGGLYKTGRKRRAVDYLVCIYCGHKECVDETFDGQWH